MLRFLIWIQIVSINAEHLCARPGEKVEIPCHNERKPPVRVEWNYYRNGVKCFLISSGTDGVKKHNTILQTQIGLLRNNSLVIDDVTAEMEGNYSCELCSKNVCKVTNTSLLLLKETYLRNETKAIATPGSVFMHSCPAEEADKMDSPATVKWTSESIRNLVITFTLHGRSATEKPKRGKMLSNGSIYLSDVDSSDAGNYSCWVQRRPCSWISLLTVNLHVQTVPVVESPVNNMSCHGALGQTTESWNHSIHEWQEKKGSSLNMAVVFGALATSLLALLLLCIVLHCRYRRSSKVTSPNEQLNLESRSTANSRSEIGEAEYHVYSVLNIEPEENCVIENQDTCIYTLIKTPSACTSGH